MAQPRELSEKQRRFVEVYMGKAQGNATLAAKLAGYKGNDNTLGAVGKENLRKPLIAAAIKSRVDKDPAILDREQLQRFWSGVANDPDVEMRDRIRASELLGKSQAAFVSRREISGKDGEPIKTEVSQGLTKESIDKLREEFLGVKDPK